MNFFKSLQQAAVIALAYARFQINKSAPNVLALLEALKIKEWRFEADRQSLNPFTPDFSLSDAIASVQEKSLLLNFTAGTGASRREYSVATRFKNDGSDKLFVNGVRMDNVSFDLDIIGVKNTLVQVELRYFDPEGRFHYDRLYNQL